MQIAVIPDTQIRKGVPIRHLIGLGNYIADKKPDGIVVLGDWWDMPSLSTHNDRGHISYENARMRSDLEAGEAGMEAFTRPLSNYKGFRHFLHGNHEYRRDRLIAQQPILKGSLPEYPVKKFGFKEHAFLKPVRINGVTFCHYAVGTHSARAISSARAIALKKHESWIVGHAQGLDIFISPITRTDGSRVQCIISGSCYTHDEVYMGPQSNKHWRGALLLNEVRNGSFDLVTLSTSYLIKEWT